MTYVLDTHVWIWMKADPGRLSRRARNVLSPIRDQDRLLVCAISVWEIARLVEGGRLALGLDLEIWIGRALATPKLSIAPLTPAIAIESNRLPGEFHRDPADRMIVATARIADATIITADEAIQTYQHARSLW